MKEEGMTKSQFSHKERKGRKELRLDQDFCSSRAFVFYAHFAAND